MLDIGGIYMRLCPNCSKEIDDALEVCPYCGSVVEQPENNPLLLAPGTVLSGRYTLGEACDMDQSSVTYSAVDNTSNIEVLIKEYLPYELASRVPGYCDIAPYDENSAALFEQGFQAFVAEAKRLFNEGSEPKLFDCIAENGTAYMIFEAPVEGGLAVPVDPKDDVEPEYAEPAPEPEEEEEVEEPAVIEPKKKKKRFPVWLAIVLPLILVIGGAGFALQYFGIFDFTTIFSAKEDDEEETEKTKRTTEDDEDDEDDDDEDETETTVTTTTKPMIEVDAAVMTFNGHSYACFTGCETWEEAEKFCENLGGHLVVINSQEENDVVWSLVNADGGKSYFIGLSDAENEGVWKWVNGDPLDYQNWNYNEPNAFNEFEDYAEFSFRVEGGVWNDSNFEIHYDDAVLGFVCEWDEPVQGTSSIKYVNPNQSNDMEEG